MKTNLHIWIIILIAAGAAVWFASKDGPPPLLPDQRNVKDRFGGPHFVLVHQARDKEELENWRPTFASLGEFQETVGGLFPRGTFTETSGFYIAASVSGGDEGCIRYLGYPKDGRLDRNGMLHFPRLRVAKDSGGKLERLNLPLAKGQFHYRVVAKYNCELQHPPTKAPNGVKLAHSESQGTSIEAREHRLDLSGVQVAELSFDTGEPKEAVLRFELTESTALSPPKN